MRSLFGIAMENSLCGGYQLLLLVEVDSPRDIRKFINRIASLWYVLLFSTSFFSPLSSICLTTCLLQVIFGFRRPFLPTTSKSNILETSSSLFETSSYQCFLFALASFSKVSTCEFPCYRFALIVNVV